jgi:hypothetical protein
MRERSGQQPSIYRFEIVWEEGQPITPDELADALIAAAVAIRDGETQGTAYNGGAWSIYEA